MGLPRVRSIAETALTDIIANNSRRRTFFPPQPAADKALSSYKKPRGLGARATRVTRVGQAFQPDVSLDRLTYVSRPYRSITPW